jgi:hypothetical protein
MTIPWTTNLLHFHLNKLFKKWFLIWHYFVWQLIWLLFKKLGDFFQIIWSLCRQMMHPATAAASQFGSKISLSYFWLLCLDTCIDLFWPL